VGKQVLDATELPGADQTDSSILNGFYMIFVKSRPARMSSFGSLKYHKVLYTVLCLGFLFGITTRVFAQQKPMLLWFDRPAYQPKVFTYEAPVFKRQFSFENRGWNEALPVGNSRLGAMVFGGVFNERIQLNEKSLWDGYRHDDANPLSAKALPQVQQLLFEGNIDSAQEVAGRTMMGVPVRILPYQSLGDFFIEHITQSGDTLYTNYRRWLSLDSAVAVTTYRHRGVNYRREVFASHPVNTIVVRISCDKPGALNLALKLMREQDAVVSSSAQEPNTIFMKGRIARTDEGGNPVGMRFASYIKGVSSSGKVSVNSDGGMTVKDATELVLYITAATSYRGSDPDESARQTLKKAMTKPVRDLFNEHLKDYQSLYGRVKINLSQKEKPMELPHDKRMARVQERSYEDAYLSELLFQYGRYLLIASSRKGDLPANLQGVWNQTMNPPWSSDYHTNINLQMNYMAAEAANLQECTLPLFGPDGFSR
jgi:alpha-L-fucosidase 2